MPKVHEIDEAIHKVVTLAEGVWISAEHLPGFVELSGVRCLRGRSALAKEDSIFYSADEIVDRLLDLRLDAVEVREVVSVPTV